jgi:hypothetical protein
MAVTQRNYDIVAGWDSGDVLTALQSALADVGYHAAAKTGILQTITGVSGGGTFTAQRNRRYLVRGSGGTTAATFDVRRDRAGAIVSGGVTIVNGGAGYSAGGSITIAGADIGGTTPTDNLTVTIGTVSGSQGSTTTWHDVDATVPPAWAICCVDIDLTKRLGQTFYEFGITPASGDVNRQYTLTMRSSPGWRHDTNAHHGVVGLDVASNATVNTPSNGICQVVFAKSNQNPLRLTTYQSGIDTNFVVFQFVEIGKYGETYRPPFFLSKYQSATQPWSLDEAFTGGIYMIDRIAAISSFDTAIAITIAAATVPRRMGEAGYMSGTTAWSTFPLRPMRGIYESNYGKRLQTPGGTSALSQDYPTIYQRTTADATQFNLEYNPVVTGLPICNVMVPVPYYIPADFGVTEVLGSNNLAYNDQISVGATTKWRVIQYSVNLAVYTYVSSMAFVARVVD